MNYDINIKGGHFITSGHFAIASLQGEEGRRRAKREPFVIAYARGVGRVVAEVALALELADWG